MQTPNFDFERSLIPPGCRYLLGIDEVGRGPLAGPVTVGAFLLDLQTFSQQEFIDLGVRDSKLLSAQKRQKIYDHFLSSGHQFKTFSASSQEIDDQGIAICIYSLISKALKFYSSSFDFCLIDGNPIKQITVARSNNFKEHSTWATTLTARKNLLPEQLSFVVKGDQKCFSIASASIVAKVDRDAQMDLFDKQYPYYGFAQNKGYGTTAHLEAIKRFGPCPIHRLSFAPLSKRF